MIWCYKLSEKLLFTVEMRQDESAYGDQAFRCIYSLILVARFTLLTSSLVLFSLLLVFLEMVDRGGWEKGESHGKWVIKAEDKDSQILSLLEEREWMRVSWEREKGWCCCVSVFPWGIYYLLKCPDRATSLETHTNSHPRTAPPVGQI